MATITTRDNLDSAPALDDLLHTAPLPEDEQAPSVTRAVTLAKCLRCGFEWLPRKAKPAQCAHCRSSLWNVPRAQQLPGKPAPTRKGKPRGRAFVSGDPRQSANKKKND